ncbi:hypothetical protein DFS34DRAFT_614064 [Phlyctochytrium arcticum]|nr:hypothetical protein DFS34DRAFT_614064 [Phlyctochytrium arcticum]
MVERTSVVKIIRILLQVLALTVVLLTWSSVDRVFKALTTKPNSLHVWFGAPRTPSVIHVGEIYNATLEWEASLAARKSYLNVSMEVGLVCAGGKDGRVAYVFPDWIVHKKSGAMYFDYPMTHEDLRSDLREALCYLNINYIYAGHTPGSPSDPSRLDQAMSAVFRLTRAPRRVPLPIAETPALSSSDQTLSFQLRADPTPFLPTANRTVHLAEPLYKVYPYTAVSIWPEDDPEFSMASTISLLDHIPFFSILLTVLILSRIPTVRKWTARALDAFSGWFSADIEDPTVPKHATRSRRRSFLMREHLPVHVS